MKNALTAIRSVAISTSISLVALCGFGLAAYSAVECAASSDGEITVAECVDADGNTAVTAIDSDGNELTVAEDSEGNRAVTAIDSDGNQVTVTEDSEGNTTTEIIEVAE